MKVQGRWIKDVAPEALAGEVGPLVVASRLRKVARAVADVEIAGDAKAVHRLRVATRRAGATIRAFGSVLDEVLVKDVRRRLRRLRRAAAPTRQCDVHARIIELSITSAAPDRKRALKRLLDRIADDRTEARKAIVATAERDAPKRLRTLAKQFRDWQSDSVATLADLARDNVRRQSRAVVEAASADLSSSANLHSLRIAIKRLRYTVEVFATCLGDACVERAYPPLVEAQEFLGAANDLHEMADWVATAIEDGRVLSDADDAVAMAEIQRQLSAAAQRGYATSLAAWRAFPIERVLADLAAGVAVASDDAPMNTDEVSLEAVSRDEPTDGFHLAMRLSPFHGALPGPQRLAAIDVGSNSIRLVIAEADPDGSYRILDDERELVRLGQGLDNSKRLSPEAMERAAVTIASMRAIADGYGVCALRAVGTSAVRDAVNKREFIEYVRQRAGVELEVISGEDEARLAHLSVAHRFDLSHGPTAVVDIGGGSTEIIISADGVIDQIHTLPLGAVRLTGKFGGAEKSASSRYREMRGHIDETISQALGTLPMSPPMVIGTGGTFTTLANLDIQRLRMGRYASAPSPSVQGYELHRSTVRHMLDLLRKTPVRARMRMPGLPSDRADIIVAGVAIVERVMKHLGANRLRIHDRGVRDGLLLTMIRELFPSSAGAPAPRDRLAIVRRFAKACRYEEAHAEHVTRLALSIFGQMATAGVDPLLDDESRFLLEAAAVLHDVGYMVNYARHHKHSYHLILHSDIEGVTPRQREIIANIARYHRRAEPSMSHENFRRLDKADRRLVRRLAGILRVADGLDRTHTQSVTGVNLQWSEGKVEFVLSARGAVDTDMWGARRKAGLFADVFGVDTAFSVGRIEPQGVPSGEEPRSAMVEA